jgi:hypothetical protein
MNITLRIIIWLVGLTISGILLRTVIRSKRRLDKRISEFKEELESNQGPTQDPYQALAELYVEDMIRSRKPPKKRKREKE